jgi:predicted Zn-ribbon and HTH transcriptional regulator
MIESDVDLEDALPAGARDCQDCGAYILGRSANVPCRCPSCGSERLFDRAFSFARRTEIVSG